MYLIDRGCIPRQSTDAPLAEPTLAKAKPMRRVLVLLVQHEHGLSYNTVYCAFLVISHPRVLGQHK